MDGWCIVTTPSPRCISIVRSIPCSSHVLSHLIFTKSSMVVVEVVVLVVGGHNDPHLAEKIGSSENTSCPELHGCLNLEPCSDLIDSIFL